MNKYLSILLSVVMLMVLVAAVLLVRQQQSIVSRADSAQTPMFADTPVEYSDSKPQDGGSLNITQPKITTKDKYNFISWDTNFATTSTFEYGFSSDLKDGNMVKDDLQRLSHTVYLPSTGSFFYYFRIKSTDSAGNTAVSQIYNFRP